MRQGTRSADIFPDSIQSTRYLCNSYSNTTRRGTTRQAYRCPHDRARGLTWARCVYTTTDFSGTGPTMRYTSRGVMPCRVPPLRALSSDERRVTREDGRRQQSVESPETREERISRLCASRVGERASVRQCTCATGLVRTEHIAWRWTHAHVLLASAYRATRSLCLWPCGHAFALCVMITARSQHGAGSSTDPQLDARPNLRPHCGDGSTKPAKEDPPGSGQAGAAAAAAAATSSKPPRRCMPCSALTAFNFLVIAFFSALHVSLFALLTFPRCRFSTLASSCSRLRSRWRAWCAESFLVGWSSSTCISDAVEVGRARGSNRAAPRRFLAAFPIPPPLGDASECVRA